MSVVHQSVCRTCQIYCPTLVTVDDGRITKVTGDPTVELYQGYTCVKGRNSKNLYGHADRLTHPLKRMPNGEFERISLDDALSEIAERLQELRQQHGNDSVAMYWGNHLPEDHPSNMAMAEAFMAAIDAPQAYNVLTIDQPGKAISTALHGVWMAPEGHKLEPDVVMVVGCNPLVSHQHQAGPPADFIRDLSRRNGQLIVIDPRRTETAKRAAIHLAPKPGEDVAILAGMLRVVFEEDLWDREFVAENVDGVEALRAAVAPFTPDVVARRADIDAVELVRAARLFGSAGRGYVIAGTGPSMSGWSTLVEYLVKCLDTVTGHHLRDGEPLVSPISFLPYAQPKAQALAPWPAFTESDQMRVRGLVRSAAGRPTAALPDEILTPGEGQVRALLSIGGNPATSWPDQLKTVKALRSLDLLVHVDVQMTTTARLADYVLPTTLPYEVPGTNALADFLPLFNSVWGFAKPFARYTPPVVQRPADSDLAEMWQILFRLAGKVGVGLEVYPGVGKEGAAPGTEPVKLDMSAEPTSEEMLDLTFAGSRVPLEEIRATPGGVTREDHNVVVAAKDPGWTGRLDVGNPLMVGHLNEVATGQSDALDDPRFPFRVTSRRLRHVWNTPTYAIPADYPTYNPLYIHPADMAELGIEAGDLVEVRSERASVRAIADADDTLRRKIVSLSHGFGGLPDEDEDPARGASIGRLLANDRVFERYSGQPLMSNIPVALVPLAECATSTSDLDAADCAPAAH
ncbi:MULTISPECIES: molybdopterin-dependent oxidoreductase [unclassified Pseudofrankia]|uniref:molybdopterin-containing oxidoreductase family protein n=1 Tax=unclassified Pseudofrankia TaxID=2994372 RepID=UPI0008DAFCE7|nr:MULTISPECIES: molybdopterin-dependent oxidoreductase [unclassified Pseudofrankia]MDT3446564.1 molybdopterin-dependent oxidoreductase [Pseudofrankia sp. BMG5.37]OHV59928.1 hypothetical protein BCD48_40955 [Pseudofrankia sp. BMG5.36]